MSKRLAVLQAVRSLIQQALPHAEVLGFDASDDAPARIAPGGRVLVQSGDMGEPEVDLCPTVYWYEHRIPIELIGASEAAVDAMMAAIGAGIDADPTLGGLCEWIEPTGPNTENIYTAGAVAPRGATFAIMASYGTPNPLT